MTSRLHSFVAIVGLLAATPLTATAGDPPNVPGQLAGLFLQSCVQFAADRDALRRWAAQIGLKRLAPQAETNFLDGQPGMVFDASNQMGKYVVISPDAGACSAMAESADGPASVAAFEQSMRNAGISFTLTNEQTDPSEKALNHRAYAASAGKAHWTLLLSTTAASAGGPVMLTVTP